MSGEVQRMSDEDRARLTWPPVIREFVGGPLDGKAIEGPADVENEAGPMSPCGEYYVRHEGIELRYSRGRETGKYMFDHDRAGRAARRAYMEGSATLKQFEQIIEWALQAERDRL